MDSHVRCAKEALLARDASSSKADNVLLQDHDKIAQLVKQHWNIALETKEISFKGWNWGAFDVQGKSMQSL